MSRLSRGGVQSGFTLIELIAVIVLLSIVGLIGGQLISQLFLGVRDTSTRIALYEEGKAALVRMERELHNMLPNAICVTNDAAASCENSTSPGEELRFAMIGEAAMRTAGLVGSYTEEPIEFPRADPASLTDSNPAASVPVGAVVSVYNLDWSGFSGGSKLFAVTGASGSQLICAGQTIADPSPKRRYYLVDRAVRYRYDPDAATLYRSVAAVSSSGPESFSGKVEYPLVQHVSEFRFYYAAPSLARNGIISLLFTMARDGHTITMHKEIHVKNVP